MKTNDSKQLLVGRNQNNKVFTSESVPLFRKIIDNKGNDGNRRFNNILIWDKLREKKTHLNSPKVLSFDTEGLSVDFEWIEPAFPIQNILLKHNERNSNNIFTDIMKVISEIHSTRPLKKNIFTLNAARGLGVLFGIDVKTYSLASGGELELFGLLHSDHDLIEAVEHLFVIREEYLNKEPVVSHGDLRIDQFILDEDERLFIVDFEEICLAHAEFDLGSLFSSLIFFRIFEVLTSGLQDTSTIDEIDDFYLGKGSAVLAETVAEINRLTEIYLEYNGKKINFELLNLEIGWAIFERLISRSKLSANLATVDKAIAGIARSILIHPQLIEEISAEEEKPYA